MCALAELLHGGGCEVSGSDTNERFYTDDILNSLHIPFFESFKSEHVPKDADLIIHSAAYTPQNNVELEYALTTGVPVLKYTDALAEYSRDFFFLSVCGVHGKTTATALCGVFFKALNISAQVLTGSAVSAFAPSAEEGPRSTLNLGNKFFAAETCEYRGHFLSFNPKITVLTNVEHDHQDFFPSYESMLDMFTRYVKKIPPDGALIYCEDDPGSKEVARRVKDAPFRKIGYGFSAEGIFKIKNAVCDHSGGTPALKWELEGFNHVFSLFTPGRHNILNATAAAALSHTLISGYGGREGRDFLTEEDFAAIDAQTALFKGGKRRCEILGEAGGTLFIDDYGHHPTAIKSTIKGIKEFYPGRRIVLSFMPHTYSRTASLLTEFSLCFEDADVVYLHDIYPSAREKNETGISGETLYQETKKRRANTHYLPEHSQAEKVIAPELQSGDIFLTMGAGDNWKAGLSLLAKRKGAL